MKQSLVAVPYVLTEQDADTACACDAVVSLGSSSVAFALDRAAPLASLASIWARAVGAPLYRR